MKNILVLNCGSSSLKYKIFSLPEMEQVLKGNVENIGEKGSPVKDHKEAIINILDSLDSSGIKKEDIAAIGHRLVHGGEDYSEPVLIDEKVIKAVRDNIKLAPIHNPANLMGIEACMQVFPDVKQVGVFDTAFHQTMPKHAYLYGLPYEIYEEHKVRKYGFHGTSHLYVAHEAAKRLGKPIEELKLITAHLGNGSSISAIKNGICIDTSMGFTPVTGLMMGTRPGDIDPSLIFYLMEEMNISAEEVTALLNKKSGLLGISGISNDIRPIEEAAEKGDKRAQLALDMFIYAVKKFMGSFIFIMGGVDAIIFTAGIGENDPYVRAEVTSDLEFLKEKPEIMVIPTNEELMIAVLTNEVITTAK